MQNDLLSHNLSMYALCNVSVFLSTYPLLKFTFYWLSCAVYCNV